jgi:hypothetical protein
MESLVNFRTRRARLAGRLDVQTQVPDAIPTVFGLSEGGTGTSALVPGAVLYSGNGAAVETSSRLLFDGAALRTNDLTGNVLLAMTTQGNVGIGTGTPQAPLHVYSDVYSNDASARIEGNVAVSGTVVCGTLIQRADTAAFSDSSRDIRDWLESEADRTKQASGAWYRQSPTRLPWGPSVPAGSDKHAGCVLLPDGRVLFVPGASGTVVRLFDTRSRSLTSVNAQQSGFSGGVLMPNGKVLFVPKGNAYIGLFDPATDTFALGPAATGYSGGVLMRNGKVFLVPSGASELAVFDPATETLENPTPGTTLAATDEKYDGGVLLHDGRVLLVPCNANHVGLFDPVGSVWSTPGPQIDGSAKYRGGVILPSGRVAFVPGANARVGLYDPSTGAFETSDATVPDQYRGGALLPDGRAIFAPYADLSPVVLYDATSDQTTEIPISSTYYGAVLADDGYVYLAPAAATTVGMIGRFDRTPKTRCVHPMFNKL